MARTAGTAKKRGGFMDVYDKPGRRYDPTIEGFGTPEKWEAAFRVRMGLPEARECIGADDPLTILGLTAAAVWSEIKAAYRKLAFETHPDRCKDADAEERFKRINAAYTVLEDRFKKKTA